MSCNNVQILNFNHNVVEVGSDNKLIITDNVRCNSVTIPQPVTNILQINSPGLQGPAGPSGSQGPIGPSVDTGSLLTTSSFNSWTGSNLSEFSGTSSYALTASYAMNGGGGSLSGGTDTYIPLWSGSTALASSFLNQSNDILKTTSASVDVGLKLNFTSGQYIFGDETDPDYPSRIYVNGGAASGDASIILSASDSILGKDIAINMSSTEKFIKIFYDTQFIGLKLDFSNGQYTLGDDTDLNYQTYAVFNGGEASGDSNLQLASVDNTISSDINLTIDGTNGYLRTAYNGNEAGLKLDFINNEYWIGSGPTNAAGTLLFDSDQNIIKTYFDVGNETGLYVNPDITVLGDFSGYSGNWMAVKTDQGNKQVSVGIYEPGNGNGTRLVVDDDNQTISITGSLSIVGDIIPGGPYTDNTSSYNLGSPTAAWKDIYVSNGSLVFISGNISSSIKLGLGGTQFNTPAVNVNDLASWAGDMDIFGLYLTFPSDFGLGFISSTTSSITLNGDVTFGGSFPLPWTWTNISLTDNSANSVSINDPYYNDVSSIIFYNQIDNGDGTYTVEYSSSTSPGTVLPNEVYTSTSTLPSSVYIDGDLSVSGSIQGTASYANSASYADYALTAGSAYAASVAGQATNAYTASYALTARSASYALTASYYDTRALATTGSNTFNGTQIITGSTQGNVTALSISSNTASLNLSSGSFFTLQLVSGSNTYINPSNIVPGLTATLLISTTGSATVTFPDIVKTGSAYTPTTTTGKDILTFISFDSTNLYLAAVKNLG